MKKTKPIMLVMLIIVVGATWYAWQGASMHRQVSVEEAKFHTLQAEYFIQSKEFRDSAETGSIANAQLVEIVNYPSELLRLKLVGVGSILIGIFILLFGILIALMIMPIRLSQIIKE